MKFSRGCIAFFRAYKILWSVAAILDDKAFVRETLHKIALVKAAVMKAHEVQKVLRQKDGSGDVELVADLAQAGMKAVFVEKGRAGEDQILEDLPVVHYLRPNAHLPCHI